MKKNCPVCGKTPSEKFRPFCSDRCRQRDLNRWLNEVYRVPGGEAVEHPKPANDDQD